MIAVNGSSFGRFGARLRRYHGGTENTNILATVRGSIPNRRAASRWLRPSICTAWRTRPYSSTPFIPRPLHKTQRATCCRIFTPTQPEYPAASVRDYSSVAYNGEFESECPGYCGAQDTFYVGTLKGVGRIYQQTFIDTYAKVAFAKLYDRKTPITAADLLNDRVLPFYDEQGIALLRVLTDRGTEYCGNPEHHEYELYLAVENIDHSRTKAKSPQTNGICERFHKTVLDEFYRVVFRKKLFRSIDELQTDLDAWLNEYNELRTHQGRWCFGKTPMQTFIDTLPLAKEKLLQVA